MKWIFQQSWTKMFIHICHIITNKEMIWSFVPNKTDFDLKVHDTYDIDNITKQLNIKTPKQSFILQKIPSPIIAKKKTKRN